ncbi:MAG: FG-GAP-like repeat-containing protein [Nostoc sp. DedQUE12a]|nr:FG-GAP-like repeat-containing protein [Nostoc sp. DedQUE12a]
MPASFTNATNFLAGTNPNSVVVEDINGDGKKDLVVANSDSDNVSVLLNDGNGGFGTPTNYPSGTSSNFVAVADFNGDSKLDFVVTNYDSGTVSLLVNNGNGGFNAPTSFLVGSQPNSIAVGDFNGDSKLDLVVANSGGTDVSLLVNDANGGFNAATSFPVGTKPYSVAVGDINGDGKLDVVAANYDSANVSVLLNNGSGGFNAATNFTAGTNPDAVAVADINGDSKLDLVVANYGSNNVSVLLNNGSGGFNAATNFAVGTGPSSVTVADIDGDGKKDLVVANSDSDNVSVLLNDGNGGFATAINFTAGSSPESVVVADFNNDSKLDLAVANSSSSNISVLFNRELVLDVDTVDENVAAATQIATFTTGSSTNQEYTYKLIAGTGDTDNAFFTIVGNSLQITDSPNFEVKSAYNIRVSSTDLTGLIVEKELVIDVNNINEIPTNLIFTAISADDDDDDDDDDDGGSSDGDDDGDLQIIGNFSTIDPDQDDEHIYSLVAGNGDTDNGAFIIEENALILNSDITKSSYKIRVRTTDLGGLSFDKELDVNINGFGSTSTEITTIFQLVNITQNIFTVKSKFKGGKGKLSIKIKSTSSKEVNELCVFNVDDDEGKIDGIAPGAEGYAKAALLRSKVIFCSLGNQPNGFNTSDLTNILEFESNTKLRFYMVSNSTTQSVLSGKASFSSVVFSSSTSSSSESSENEGFSLNFQSLVVTVEATNQQVTLGTGLQGKKEGELIDLRDVKQSVKADFKVHREAALNNCVGFYQIADESGGIDTNNDGVADILVGQAGYAEAAVRGRVTGIDLTVTNQGTASHSGTFAAGSLFAPFIIVNGKPDAFVDENSSNNPTVYFAFLGSNTDKADHIRLLANNTFGFEDLANGGDKDYNDIIVQINLTANAV